MPERTGAAPCLQAYRPNPWIRIGRDDVVTVTIDRSEMGQGVVTGLAMLVAEELDVAWASIRTEFAPADPVYNNPLFDEQTTGGSTSIRGAWEPLRRAAAQARAALVEAAASLWSVAPDECRTDRGRVRHLPSGREMTYGELVPTAAAQAPPPDTAPKSPDGWRLIGTSVPRLEIPDMVRGRTVYGLDVRVPGALVVALARPPTIGGAAAGFDADATLRVPGVRQVLELDPKVAVVADNAWAALQGLQQLQVEWSPGPYPRLDNARIRAQLLVALDAPGRTHELQGNAQAESVDAAYTLDAIYETPYLAHGCMEPMNCTAHVRAGRCDVWVGTQSQHGVRQTVEELTGLKGEQVQIHSLFLGGGFGRRLEQDFVAEAVRLSMRLAAPVQTLWTRADDLRHDRFRPAHASSIRAGCDARGRLVAWAQRVAGPELVMNGIDLPYATEHREIRLCDHDPGVPSGSWRSVGAAQHAFAIESAIDELAHTLGRDPLAFRLGLLDAHPRIRRVLERAADEAGWPGPTATSCFQGLACYRSFGSIVAEVAEVEIVDGLIRVPTVICAIDCGTVVNPDAVAAQLEGAVAFALSAALHEEVRIEQGAIQATSFSDYPILTAAEMPEVQVHCIASDRPPGGVGEPGVPPLAPAVANAVFRATGQRLRRLPLQPQLASM